MVPIQVPFGLGLYCSLKLSLFNGGGIIKPPAILVIEKDERIGTRVTAALEGAGYMVTRAAGALEGLDKLYQTYPDVVIMDVRLPDGSGVEACRDIRANNPNVKVIMVNGEDAYLRIRQASRLPMIIIGSQEEAVELLELGADAFMEKPPNLVELVARVGRLLKRKARLSPKERTMTYTIENDLHSESNGFSTLSAIEFRLALCLILGKGRVINYSQLIEEVWGDREVNEVILHAYMDSLKEKLQAFFRGRIKITNYRGIGYCLEEEDIESFFLY